MAPFHPTVELDDAARRRLDATEPLRLSMRSLRPSDMREQLAAAAKQQQQQQQRQQLRGGGAAASERTAAEEVATTAAAAAEAAEATTAAGRDVLVQVRWPRRIVLDSERDVASYLGLREALSTALVPSAALRSCAALWPSLFPPAASSAVRNERTRARVAVRAQPHAHVARG
eukprot:3542096-Prymnesium_polylepis.1